MGQFLYPQGPRSVFWFLLLIIVSGFFTIVGTTNPSSVKLNHDNLIQAEVQVEDGVLAKSLKYFQNILSTAVLDEDSVTDLPKSDSDDVNSHPKEHGKEAENSSSIDLDKLREEIRRRLAIYKSEVELVHDLGETSRNEFVEVESSEEENSDLLSRSPKIRRAVITASNTLPSRRRRNITQEFQAGGTQVVTRIYRRQPQPFDDKIQADINVLKVKSDYYIFSIEKQSGSQPENLVIYQIEKDLNPREIIRREVPGATTVETIEINGHYYFIVGKYSKETTKDPLNHGSHVYHINFARNRLTAIQTVNTDFARSIKFWEGTGEEANDVYLGIAHEYKITPKGKSNNVEVDVYRWLGAHFDYVNSVPACNPQAISFANIQSHGYLAVANYQDDTGTTTIHSEIFKYEHKESKYLSRQKFTTYGAKDIKHFSISAGYGEEYFLAVANYGKIDEHGKINHHVKSRIMKYASTFFIDFQGLDTYGAFQILPIKEGRSKFLLVVADLRGLQIYQYSGWKFVRTMTFRLCESEVLPHSIHLRSFSYQNEPYLAIASQHHEVKGGIYNTEFKQKGHNELASDVEKWCMAAWETVRTENIPNLVEKSEAAPKITDREIVLSSSLSFSKALTAELLFTKKLIYGERIFDRPFSKQLVEREDQLKSLRQDILDIVVKLLQSVMRDGTQTINTPIEFSDVEYSGQTLKVDDVHTTTLNGFNVNDVLDNAIDVNKNYEFNSVALPKVIAKGNTRINKLNGLPLDNYARKSSSVAQTFVATNIFDAEVISIRGLNVHGLFDTIDFEKRDFLIDHINQTFRSMNIRDSVTNDLIADSVNGVNIKHYMDEAVPKNGDAIITGRKEFESIDVKNWRAASLIGRDINVFYNTSMPLDASHFTFTGRKTQFLNLIAKSIQVTSSIANDHINLDNDLISTTFGSYELDTLEFDADVFVDRLLVRELLNEIKVIDGKLDIVLKSTRDLQLISNKVLEAIVLEKDSEADGLVDNVMLKGWSHIREIELSSNHIRFGSLKTKGHISIPNGIHIDSSTSSFIHDKNDVSHVLAQALRLDAQKLPDDFRGKIIFNDLHVEGDSEVRDTINELKHSDWLLKNSQTNEVTTITGKKTFDGPLTLLSPSTTVELFGSKDRSAQDILKGFDDLLINGREQTVKRNTIFEGLLQVNKLDCPNLILNGVHYKNLFFTSADQEIQGTVNFKSIKVNDEFEINGDLTVKNVNHRDLSSDIRDTLRTTSSTPQIVIGEYSFDKELRVTNLNVQGGLIGDENPSTFLDNIIRNDGVGNKAIQGGTITFRDEVEIEQLRFTGTLNEIRPEEWGHGLLLTHGNQVITASTNFKNSVTASGDIIVTSGKISGFDIATFEKNYLRINQGGPMGVVYFHSPISVEEGVSLGPGGTVNRFNLRKDIFLKNTEKTQTVTGAKKFRKLTTIHGNLDVTDLQGFHYDAAARFVFGKTRPTENLKIKGNLNIKDEMLFSHKFNGELWPSIIEGVWWTDQDFAVPTDAHFKNKIIFKDGVQLTGLLNGVDIVAFSKEYLSRSQNQVIGSGPTVFENDVTFEHLKVNKIHVANGEVNHINLVEFRDSVLLQGVDQKIVPKMSFENVRIQDIIVESGTHVGGIDLSEHAMTLHGENIVTWTFTFHDLNVQELTIGPGTKINGIDLDEWSANSARINEHGAIKSTVHFDKAAFPNGVTVHGLVDGIKFSRDNIFTLSDDQTVEGLYTFEQNSSHTQGAFLAPNGITVDGNVNGFNLQELIQKWVKDDGGRGPLDVFGEKTFNQQLFADEIKAEGLFQEQDLDAVIRDLEAKTHISSEEFNFSLEEKYQELITIADRLRKLRKAKFLEFFEWVEVHRVQSSRKVTSLDIFEEQKIIFLQQSENHVQHVLSGHYIAETNIYRPDSSRLFTVTGRVQEFVGIHRGDEYYIFMSVRSVNNQVASISECKIEKGNEIEKSDKLSKAFLLKLHETHGKGSLTFTIKQEVSADDVGNVATFVQFLSDETYRHCVASPLKNSDGSKVMILCFKNKHDQWFQHTQTLPAENPSLVNSMTVGKFTTILAVASNNIEEKTGVVDVWAHGKGDHAFKKIDCIPVVNLVSMDASRGFNDNAFLALASGYVKKSLSYGHVYIYRYSKSKKQLVKQQTFAVDNPIDVKFQHTSISKESFLYVLKSASYQNLLVYSYRGSSGWVLEHILTVEGAKSLGTATFEVNKVFRAKLMVRSQDHVDVFDLEFNGISYGKGGNEKINGTRTLSIHRTKEEVE